MDRNNIEKIAQGPDDRLLLAKIWDKITLGIRRNILANTSFLSPREQQMAQYLFGDQCGITFFGGYADAERKMLIFLPDYADEAWLSGDESPLVCLRASFYEGDTPSHRDFLGALMGSGIARETVGDICVGTDWCDFFVTKEIAPYVLQNLPRAGHAALRLEQIPLDALQIQEPETQEIRDTLASLRLDSVISAGFRIGRSLAVQHIHAGRASVNGLPCEKPDRSVEEGTNISVRGLGKIKLRCINGQTKKGRISVVIDRYI